MSPFMAATPPAPDPDGTERARGDMRPISNHFEIERSRFRIVNHSFTARRSEQETELRSVTVTMSAAKSKSVEERVEKSVEAIGVPEPTCRNTAAHALTIVRDGVLTGEGPTTKGRVHFSRALDADDAAWCARILTAGAVEHQPVSRAEAEALFAINDAASERSDGGRFDDLLAKAIAHHAAAEAGLPVPSRTVALSPDTEIASWAPNHATQNAEVLEWIASQMRGKPLRNRALMTMIATFLGITALPLAQQLPNVFDIGM